jgi:uncharacterized protein (TIGR02118 family)
MVKFCVFYYGSPEDPTAFDKYYWNHHLQLVKRWPRIKRIVLSKGQPGSELYQMVELYFDSSAEMDAALCSPERAISYEDGQKLPRFVGEIKRQAFEVIDYVEEEMHASIL